MRWLLRGAVLLLVLLGKALLAADAEPRNVLLISTYGSDFPSTALLEAGFEEGLQYRSGRNHLYFEYLDMPRLSFEDATDGLADYLARKYRSVDIDYIIAWHSLAARFLEQNPELFGAAQRVYLEVAPEQVSPGATPRTDAASVVSVNLDYSDTLAEIKRIIEPRKLLVIWDSTDANSGNRIDSYNAAKARVMPDVEDELLVDLSIDAIRQRLHTAAPGTIALYLLMFNDGRGNTLTPFEAMQQISPGSEIPIFSFWESLTGSGAVGGRVFSHRAAARSLSEYMLLDADLRAVRTVEATAYSYDYAALLRWGIPLSRIPPEADVINRPLPVLDVYFREIMATLALLLVLLLLSLGLTRALLARNAALKALAEERNSLAAKVAERTVALTTMNADLIDKNEELHRLLHEVKTLSGIIPICSYCKKIRDDQGYWDQVEAYMSRQTAARFSHSICPDCMPKARADVDEL